MDKSCFLHKGTGIPYEVLSFFGLNTFDSIDGKGIVLFHAGKEFPAHFQFTEKKNQTRLFWNPEFTSCFVDYFPKQYKAYLNERIFDEETVIMRFKRESSELARYEISFFSERNTDVNRTNVKSNINRSSVMISSLIKYGDYSREEVHALFSPETTFTPQAGTWGLHGIVKIPNRPGDFVFFVTFGQKQGDHHFVEGITEEGILSWQSQPRQGFASKKIKKFIAHDEAKNRIYLFLRTSKYNKYTYMGHLKYQSHDPRREFPVYFTWQILDWNIPKSVLERMDLILLSSQEKKPKLVDEENVQAGEEQLLAQDLETQVVISFGSRVKDALSKLGICTLFDLLHLNPDHALKLHGHGKKTYKKLATLKKQLRQKLDVVKANEALKRDVISETEEMIKGVSFKELFKSLNVRLQTIIGRLKINSIEGILKIEKDQVEQFYICRPDTWPEILQLKRKITSEDIKVSNFMAKEGKSDVISRVVIGVTAGNGI